MSRDHRFPSAIASGELSLPDNGRLGVLNARLVAGLAPLADRLICEQGLRPEHDRLAAAGFTTSRHIDGRFDAVTLFLSRHRNVNRANIARAVAMLEPGGILVLDGQKTEGIDSLLREVRKYLPIAETLSRGHGKLAWTTQLDETPSVPQEWAINGRMSRNDDGFMTAPGMFSAAHVDAGSRRLAQHFSAALRGHVADLGAGWGWLSATLLENAPGITACDLFEADHLSLEAARQNLSDNRAGFHWADVTQLQAGREAYDFVFSNPPFHQDRAAEPELGASFVAAAARILKPKGTALFVANRQLPYEHAFETHFADWAAVEADRHFKVIRARRPRGPVANRQ